jgi:uncharacterized protein (TIGR02284 family)
LIDARRGYEEALRESPDGDVADLFRQMLDVRTKAIDQIRDALAAAGETGDEHSSFMSLVHRTVVSIRVTVERLGPDSLPTFANGEARIMLAYNSAIDECRPYPKIARVLEAQRAALAAIVARMNQAAASAPVA